MRCQLFILKRLLTTFLQGPSVPIMMGHLPCVKLEWRGRRRKITVANPGFKYTSANEKVATVIPPGEWSYSDGQIGTNYALVKATGPGKTSITVQYGELTDRVTVNVKGCPYTEGMKRCRKTDRSRHPEPRDRGLNISQL